MVSPLSGCICETEISLSQPSDRFLAAAASPGHRDEKCELCGLGGAGRLRDKALWRPRGEESVNKPRWYRTPEYVSLEVPLGETHRVAFRPVYC